MFRLTKDEGAAVEFAGLEPWELEDAVNESDFLNLETFIESIEGIIKTIKGKLDYALIDNLKTVREELVYWMEKKYMEVVA